MKQLCICSLASYFNPRSLAGATLRSVPILSMIIIFQSTLPRGSDVTIRPKSLQRGNFNPRSLAGATKSTLTPLIELIDFNPRSLAGATLHCLHDRICRCDFNPRSLAGATLVIISFVLPRWNFNPRSLAGATSLILINDRKARISIHAPSRERRWL